jgi:acyl carrier protein
MVRARRSQNAWGAHVSRVAQVFSSVLELPIEQITDRTSPRNTPEWDSLAGMNLVLAIEAEFRVKLTSKEINSMRTVAIVRKVLTSKGAVDV